jgi:hypothetical protein
MTPHLSAPARHGERSPWRARGSQLRSGRPPDDARESRLLSGRARVPDPLQFLKRSDLLRLSSFSTIASFFPAPSYSLDFVAARLELGVLRNGTCGGWPQFRRGLGLALARGVPCSSHTGEREVPRFCSRRTPWLRAKHHVRPSARGVEASSGSYSPASLLALLH